MQLHKRTEVNLKPKAAQNQLADSCGQAVSLVFAQHVPGTQPAFRSRDLDEKKSFYQSY